MFDAHKNSEKWFSFSNATQARTLVEFIRKHRKMKKLALNGVETCRATPESCIKGRQFARGLVDFINLIEMLNSS